MRFCQSHWDRLRKAIEDRGLGALVSKDAEEAVRRAASSVGQKAAAQSFDPLMSAHMLILNNAVRVGGRAMIMGDGCPLCLLNARHKSECAEPGCSFSFDGWIERGADEALAAAKALGLVGGG